MGKKIIKLTEQDLMDMVQKLVSEQKVYDNHDKSYNYKVVDGKWMASKKGENKFFSLEKYPKAISKLDKAYPDAREQSENKPVETPKKEESKVKGETVPFSITNKEEGDKFRGFVNKVFPKTSKKLDLDPTGSFNNSYIKKAWDYQVPMKSGKMMSIGKYYTIKAVGDSSKKDSSLVLNPHIDKTMVASDTLKVNSISQSKKIANIMQYDKDDCAQFVNDFTKTRKVIGDAWLSHDIDGAGDRVHSIYTSIDNNDIQKYIELYEKVVNGENVVSDIKSFNEELISKGPKPSGLKVDDVVGIYYPPSTNHEKAFKNAGKNYFVNGDPKQPGKTLKGGRGFSFNTHVGIVGAIKNGTPIVFHNVHGTVYSEPASNLQITWVKRA